MTYTIKSTFERTEKILIQCENLSTVNKIATILKIEYKTVSQLVKFLATCRYLAKTSHKTYVHYVTTQKGDRLLNLLSSKK